jgi:hypothetical protein
MTEERTPELHCGGRLTDGSECRASLGVPAVPTFEDGSWGQWVRRSFVAPSPRARPWVILQPDAAREREAEARELGAGEGWGDGDVVHTCPQCRSVNAFFRIN